MTDYTYHVDGELVSAEDASVPVRDRGFMYGDAAFETLRVYNGTPFEWEAHIDRLRRTCDTLGFAEAVPPAEDLRERVEETLAANDLADARLKLSITRGVQPGALTPDERVDPTVVVTVEDLPRGGTDGYRVWEEHARLKTVETRRIPNASVPAAAKTHNYLNGILARLELRETDYNEALHRSHNGYLTEGATSNLFFVDVGTLKTPTPELPVLPGITADVVLDLAQEAGIPIETGVYEPAELRRASEAFVTNSTWEIRPVSLVDDTHFDPGAITRRLQERFDERVEALY